MITLSRLNRTQVALNPDLIERVEETPDTVVTLIDGKKILVLEDIDAIIEKIVVFRALVAARSNVIDVGRLAQADLHLVEDARGGTSSDGDSRHDEAVADVTPLDENGAR